MATAIMTGQAPPIILGVEASQLMNSLFRDGYGQERAVEGKKDPGRGLEFVLHQFP
jgi:hypothetical protein